MSIEMTDLLLLLAAAQGLFLTALIFHKHGKEKALYRQRVDAESIGGHAVDLAHNLSEVINTQLEQNFFDFVNHYRLEKVKKDLADPAKGHLTLLAIVSRRGSIPNLPSMPFLRSR